jgi:UDP-3-O-[3-hydroxymyristoyl] glucosamine N-acyltransferase
MSITLAELARALDADVLGDTDVCITGLASLTSAKTGDLVFVESENNLATALASEASAVIAGDFACKVQASKSLLLCTHPRLAFAKAADLVLAGSSHMAQIHESAEIHLTAQLGLSVSVAANAVVGANAKIGEGTSIGEGCVIGEGVEIGTNSKLYPRVTIYPGTRLGDNVVVHAGAVLGSDGFGYVKDPAIGEYVKFPQIGALIIEGDVEIGANSTIDRGALDSTRIGRGTKIDNLVHIGHNVQVGHRVVIAAQTGISGSAIIEDDVVIAGQVGIADHVRIESGAILGAQSGIPTNKVIRGKGVVFWGTPARPIKEYLKQLAALTRLTRGKD